MPIAGSRQFPYLPGCETKFSKVSILLASINQNFRRVGKKTKLAITRYGRLKSFLDNLIQHDSQSKKETKFLFFSKSLQTGHVTSGSQTKQDLHSTHFQYWFQRITFWLSNHRPHSVTVIHAIINTFSEIQKYLFRVHFMALETIISLIWVFPKCFHWIRWIQWQKYLSLQ